MSRLSGSGPEPFDACPDGGRCWHECPIGEDGKGLPCWRVSHAGPLSSYGTSWAPEDRKRHSAERGYEPAVCECECPRCTAKNDTHDSCRRATARAWGAFLELALLDRLEDGTPVLALVFEHHPTLKRRLAEALSTRPIPPAVTEEE